MYLIRSVRVTCGMSQMDFRRTPKQIVAARQYVATLKKRGKVVKLDKMVQIVRGRKANGELDLTPIMTEQEFNARLKAIRAAK
jgi:hypothetical protein